VTDRAIARIDAEIGAGAELSPPGPILPDLPAPLPVERGPAPQAPAAPEAGAAEDAPEPPAE